jgi:hypothetical protein
MQLRGEAPGLNTQTRKPQYDNISRSSGLGRRPCITSRRRKGVPRASCPLAGPDFLSDLPDLGPAQLPLVSEAGQHRRRGSSPLSINP